MLITKLEPPKNYDVKTPPIYQLEIFFHSFASLQFHTWNVNYIENTWYLVNVGK